MLFRQLILSITFGLFLSLLVHTQTVSNTAPTLGPVIRAYYEALRKNDDAGLSRVLSSKFLSQIKEDMKRDREKSIARYIAATDYRKGMPPVQVKDEIIVGDKGTAKVKGMPYKNWTPIGFVKENGTWRLSSENPNDWNLSPVTTQPPAAQAKIRSNTFPANDRENIGKSKNLFIGFERSICLGTCPAYKVTIMVDGSLKYDGEFFVKTFGPVSSKLTNQQMSGLRSAIRKANYFSFRSSYETAKDGCNSGTDEPWAFSLVRINGRRKSIDHYYGCYSATGSKRFTQELQRLTDFELQIDKIINLEQWIDTSEWRSKLTYPPLKIQP
jgi:hypothetical protein